MYNKEEQNLYYIHKLLISIIFDLNNESYKDVEWLCDIKSLKILEILIQKFVERGFLSQEIKNNIYEILIYLRDIRDENYKERIEIINRITINLNSQKQDKSLDYYYHELYVRTREHKKLKKYTDRDIELEIPYINKSIYVDSLVIISHHKEITDEEFRNNYLDYFINNGYYFESLNTILKECPSLFENELFKNRVELVLKNNKKTKRYFKDTYKDVKKLIKKK